MLHRTPFPAVSLAFLLLLALTAPLSLTAQTRPAEDGMEVTLRSDIEWTDLNIPGLDSGLKLAVIYGNPAEPGAPYVIRLILPHGYRFPVHYHPMSEHVTVLAGTFLLGMGDKENEDALVSYGMGDFLYIPARDLHFARSKGQTMLQAHGVGPFDTVLVK